MSRMLGGSILGCTLGGVFLSDTNPSHGTELVQGASGVGADLSEQDAGASEVTTGDTGSSQPPPESASGLKRPLSLMASGQACGPLDLRAGKQLCLPQAVDATSSKVMRGGGGARRVCRRM